MKVKRFICAMLALMAVTSCITVNSKAATSDYLNNGELAIQATRSFSFEVRGNTAVQAASSFPLEAGEIVTIKASYSPFSASVDFGLIAPDGLFYGLNTTTGSFDGAIEVNQRGYYYLAVRNNSSEAISVSGYVNY